jgi:hypothetical protein
MSRLSDIAHDNPMQTTHRAQGLSGRQLIQRLLPEDWAAPPRVVEIAAPSLDVLITIPYH